MIKTTTSTKLIEKALIQEAFVEDCDLPMTFGGKHGITNKKIDHMGG